MSPPTLFSVQFTLSLVLAGVVAMWYVAPALRRRPVSTALVPLFLVHALRYLPSSAFAPGQIGSNVPMDAMATIAYGDLASAVLAIIAALFLHNQWTGAIPVAWVVNIVMTMEWLFGGYIAASRKLVTYPMGGNWYIINYYVPVIGVIHVMIFARLVAGEARMRPAPQSVHKEPSL